MKHYSNSASWRRYKSIIKSNADIELREPSREYYLTVLGHHVHMDEWLPNGAPTGTVLLVHGAGGNGRILAPIAQLVCDMGWRVLSPDLPGYGLTEIKHGFDWDYNEWPKIIAAIAENEPGKKALLGMSVGGLTALYAAQLAGNISGFLLQHY